MWKIFHTKGDFKGASEGAHRGEAFQMSFLQQGLLPGIRIKGPPRAAQEQRRKAVQMFPLSERFPAGKCPEIPREAPQQGEGFQVPAMQQGIHTTIVFEVSSEETCG